MKIPWAVPYIDNRELKEVTSAIQANWLSMGERVRKLEALWAEYFSARHAIAVSNGTIALQLALSAIGIGPGDEVVVPAMTYIATVNPVVLCGARPVFADIENYTFNLDPEDIEHRITNKTRAIIYIDYGGNPADSEGILAVGKEHGIPVLQDAAQSLGGSLNGRPLGFQSQLSTTSFHSAKLVTTVEGGMIFTNESEVAHKLRILRNQGEDPEHKYHHVMVGFNARMTDLQAAIGLIQFEKFDEIVTRRAEVAESYNCLLRDQIQIDLIPRSKSGNRNSWFFFPVRVPNRDEVVRMLKNEGVATRVAYPLPIYKQEAYSKFVSQNSTFNCPVAEEFTKKVINLPMFHQMTSEQQEYVADKLIEAVKELDSATESFV